MSIKVSISAKVETPLSIFVTGGTGYIGSRLIKLLLAKGHKATALVRSGSEAKIPPGCDVVLGNALDASTYKHLLTHQTVFVHLIGVSKPNPSKTKAFNDIDLASVKAAVKAAEPNLIQHFVYLSVAQTPSKIMQFYQNIRAHCEQLILAKHYTSVSILRPWYVIGPGHYWPLLFLPLYWLLKKLPSTRQKAENLDLVWLNNILANLVYAIENPNKSQEITYYEIANIKQFSLE
ncbi:MAG: SDR family oxidoreductase [Chitinophagales bacterium]|nr:SDR family oxidoreductase [Chitinophagales bacterium]MCC7056222.1 SDR family oxidoreductase [Chitinophagales bacterium]MDA0199122.1 SDR family oxidoreductase [Bacteroidota bacterium]